MPRPRRFRGPLGTTELEADGHIIGALSQFRAVLSKIEKVAAGNANVCITGESGTGKELIARPIHYKSERRDQPLVTREPRWGLLARAQRHALHR
jgi:transcriptional regulator with GAF, ATPase, and Fis domain